MLPKKELQELAHALKTTPEYTEMVRRRRRIMGNPRLSRVMMYFEREHARVLHIELSESEYAARLKKLYANYKGFFALEDVRQYIEAAKNYQKIIEQSIDYLYVLMEIKYGKAY